MITKPQYHWLVTAHGAQVPLIEEVSRVWALEVECHKGQLPRLRRPWHWLVFMQVHSRDYVRKYVNNRIMNTGWSPSLEDAQLAAERALARWLQRCRVTAVEDALRDPMERP